MPLQRLFFYDSFVGANAGASAAADAFVGIDDVLSVSGAYSVDGALGFAGTAVDAVVGDYICHSKKSPCFYVFYNYITKAQAVSIHYAI